MLYNAGGMVIGCVIITGLGLASIGISKLIMLTKFKKLGESATGFSEKVFPDLIKFAYLSLMFASMLDTYNMVKRTGFDGVHSFLSLALMSVLGAYVIFDVVMGYIYSKFLKKNGFLAKNPQN